MQERIVPQPVVAELINGLAAALTAVLLYDLARRLVGDRAARLVAVAACLWPSMVLWSALNLKDALTVLIVTAVLWLLERFQRRPTLVRLALAALVIVAIESIRPFGSQICW